MQCQYSLKIVFKEANGYNLS